MLERTVDDAYSGEIAWTALISANAHTNGEWVRSAGWYHVDQIWAHSWVDEAGTVLPRPVTESAVYHWQHNNPDRMIVWYLQPHIHFLTVDWSEGFKREWFGEANAFKQSVWKRLRDGDLATEEAWRVYRENLNHVLDHVEELLENLDADRPVITSDHGNGFGEWRIYGHPRYILAPCLMRVPWAPVKATDKKKLSHAAPPETDDEMFDVRARLRNLGYRCVEA